MILHKFLINLKKSILFYIYFEQNVNHRNCQANVHNGNLWKFRKSGVMAEPVYIGRFQLWFAPVRENANWKYIISPSITVKKAYIPPGHMY